MMGRRTAALLCVLLLHALALFVLLHLRQPAERERVIAEPEIAPITWLEEPKRETRSTAAAASTTALSAPGAPRMRPQASPRAPASPVTAGEPSGAITPPAVVDWPLEGRKAAEREVQREIEAERLAKT